MINVDDPVALSLEAMREAGVDMNQRMEFRFACDVTDVCKAYAIVRATRAIGYDAAIEVFDDDHDFDRDLARERTDLTRRSVTLTGRAALAAAGLAARISDLLGALGSRDASATETDYDERDDDTNSELIWISFVTYIRPTKEAIADVTETWDAVLAGYGARCDGWEVDPNKTRALEHA